MTISTDAFDFTKREQLVKTVVSMLTQSLLAGSIPNADFIAEMLEGQPATAVRDWIKKHSDITEKDLEKALRNYRIKQDLGCVPAFAAELVEAVVKRDKMKCLYNGQIIKDTVPMFDGLAVSNDDLKNTDISDKVYFSCPSKANLAEFQRQLRMKADKHKLPISRDAINDAVVDWVEIRRRERRYDIFTDLRGPREDMQDVWMELAKRLFVCNNDTPADFVVAVLKKFMHQVLRKLRGLPVYDHLMPVILGPQGTGKSTFVRAMLGPIKELVLAVDFKMIEDDRNIDLWNSYVLFIDEMGFASKANIDTIKNSITAETLTRRPLFLNSKIEVDQNATFIGCSNKELEQLIKDPTGIRRFVALTYSNTPDWSYLNGIDWRALWQSVDQDGPDGMRAFKTTLVQVQEATREMGRVEEWLTDFQPKLHPCFDLDRQGRVRAKLLYDYYRRYEDEYYPGNLKTSLTEWGNEMRRMEKSGQNNRFSCLGKVGGNVYYSFHQ